MMEIAEKPKKQIRNNKKGWRKIDQSEILDVITKNTQKLQLPQKKVEALEFKIDNGKLDPDRFKKKPLDESKLSKHEQKRIKQLCKQEKKINSVADNKIVDPWDCDQKTVQKIASQNDIKAVILPHDGQSINPSYKSHQDLVNQAIENEMKEEVKVRFQKEKTTPRQIYSEKEKNHMANQIQNIKKDLNARQQKIREKIQLKEKKLDEEKKNQKQTGIVLNSKKIGPTPYQQQPINFQLEEDICENMRQIEPSTKHSFREAYDSIYRQNKLDNKNFLSKGKNRERKIALKKVKKFDHDDISVEYSQEEDQI